MQRRTIRTSTKQDWLLGLHAARDREARRRNLEIESRANAPVYVWIKTRKLPSSHLNPPTTSPTSQPHTCPSSVYQTIPKDSCFCVHIVFMCKTCFYLNGHASSAFHCSSEPKVTSHALGTNIHIILVIIVSNQTKFPVLEDSFR